LQAEIDKLTGDVEKSLALTTNSTDREKETTNLNATADKGEPVLQTPGAKDEEKHSVGEAYGTGSKAQSEGKL
jgi:hypothetical protein